MRTTRTNIEARSHEHALIVVASGRGRLADLFPPITEDSPYAEPRRRLFHGLQVCCRGPGVLHLACQGEVFGFAPFVDVEARVSTLLIETVPGGDLDTITHSRGDFERSVLDLLRVHAPSIAARIGPPEFGLTRAQGGHRGAIVPVARQNHRQLKSGHSALASLATRIF